MERTGVIQTEEERIPDSKDTAVIIDGHAHACGEFLRAEGIIGAPDANGVDRVFWYPGSWAANAVMLCRIRQSVFLIEMS